MLLKAAKNNNIEDVKKALLNEENINIQDNRKNTALIWASYHKYIDIVKLLLENPEKTKININIQDNYGKTALIYASYYGYTEIVKLLLRLKEIDINIQNNYKNTALINASIKGHTKIVKLLLESSNKTNLDINIQNYNKNTALIIASRDEYTDIVKLLLKHRKIKLYDVLHYTQIKEILRKHSANPLTFWKQPKKEVKYYDKRF